MEPQKPKRLTKKRILIIILIVVLLAGGGVAAYFAFFSGGLMGEEKTNQTSQQTVTQTPTQDLMALIDANSSLSKFGQLLTVSGVKFTLQTMGTNYLVLAFNNGGINNLPAGYFDGLLTTEKQTIAQNMNKYLVAIQPATDLTDGQHLKMLSGQEVIVGLKNGKYTFIDAKGNTAKQVGESQRASNGLLIVVDSILLPQ